jgi:hypothetical protein
MKNSERDWGMTNPNQLFGVEERCCGAPIKRLSSGNMEFDSRKARER